MTTRPKVPQRGRRTGSTRAQLAAQAHHLRHVEGLTGIEIAQRLDVGRSYAYELLSDPTGERATARKRKGGGTCVDCGGWISPRGGSSKAPALRCLPCYRAWVLNTTEGRESQRGTAEAMRTWTDAEMLGFLKQASIGGMVSGPMYEAARRRARRRWPTRHNYVVRFGSWAEACDQAGLRPHHVNRGYRPDRTTDTELLAPLITLRNRLGHWPTCAEYEDYSVGNPRVRSLSLVRIRFGGMIAAIEQAKRLKG
jgi:hypothetical protein